jgi:hypothetical protein
VKRTPLKSRSAKETKRLRSYEKARATVYERCGGQCEARTPWCQTGACEQVHHRKGRDGALIDDTTLLLGVCSMCHNYIHYYPAKSYEAGWLIKRNGEQHEHHGRTTS